MDPLIVPAPRDAEWGEPLPGRPTVTEVADPALPAQGYELTVTAEGATLAHADDAGRRYGRSTVEQLVASGWREARVRDHPDLAHRGFMLDVSRDRVPDRACLGALLTWLERLRVNHLELYTEHTFAYRDHEVVWRDASPLTADDYRWLDVEAAARGIRLVANQNCFGHFERWLAHDEYRPRALDPAADEPRSLAPTPDNAAFALGLVRELSAQVAARSFTIGGDEVFELHGRPDVFVEHLVRLLDGTRALGLRPRFWADMVQSDPAGVAERIGEATALLWHYEAPMPESAGDLLADLELPPPFDAVVRDWIESRAHLGFGPRAERFAGAGLDWWVCPGTSGWNSFVGRWSNARGNALDAVESASAYGASGMMVTEWGDNGHLQPPTVMLPALTFAASVAWCRATNADQDTARALDGWVLPDAAGSAGAALLRAGEAYARTGVIQPNGSALHDAVAGGGMGGFGAPTEATTADVVGELDAAAEALERARFTDADGETSRRELIQAVALARHGAWCLARRHGLPAPAAATLDDELAALREEQAACWSLRSRPGGLPDSLARLHP